MNDTAIGTRHGAGPARPLSRRRRRRTLVERYLFIPCGLLWLGLLALLSLPIMIFMTLLYYLARPFAALNRPARRRPDRSADTREPAA